MAPSRWSCVRCWATASTAATTASWPALEQVCAHTAVLADFDARPGWQALHCRACWAGPSPSSLRRTEGSAIRRIGFQRWQRNLAVAAGNALHAGHAPSSRLEVLEADFRLHALEHVRWPWSTPAPLARCSAVLLLTLLPVSPPLPSSDPRLERHLKPAQAARYEGQTFADSLALAAAPGAQWHGQAMAWHQRLSSRVSP